MNRLEHITHDPAGRHGLVIGLAGGCTAMVLSKIGKAIFFPHLSRSRTRLSASRPLRHVTYPRQRTEYIELSTGC